MLRTKLFTAVLSLAAIIMILSVVQARGSETDVNNAEATRFDLSGKVQDSKGAPLEGVAVAVLSAHPRVGPAIYCPYCYQDCTKIVQTDSTGKFLIRSLAPDLIFRLLLVKFGYATAEERDIDPSTSIAKFRLERADPGKDDIIGSVFDKSGSPVRGASVEYVGLNLNNGEGIFGGSQTGIGELAVTDDKGRYRFQFQKDSKGHSGPKWGASSIYATVVAAGHASKTLMLRPGADSRNNVRLGAGATVIGQVIGSDGQPIANAEVEEEESDGNCETFTGWITAITDNGGRFTLPNAAPGQKSVLSVRMLSLLKSDGEALQCDFTTPGDGKTVDIGTIETSPSTTVSGRLSVSGSIPLPDECRVALARVGTWDVQQEMIGPDGSFSFRGVPTGEKMTLFSNLVIGSKYYVASQAIIVPSEGTTSLNLVLSPMK
jgi:protocatechuate 3,4-dioxygenase beta subunit